LQVNTWRRAFTTSKQLSAGADQDATSNQFKDIWYGLGSKMSWAAGLGVGTVFLGGTVTVMKQESADLKARSDATDAKIDRILLHLARVEVVS